MNEPKLSKEEKQILEDFEAGEFKSILTPRRKKMLQVAAEETFKKDKRINIRISSRDLESLQRRALEEGIPYQTLVSSVLHKYVSGGLHDIMANKAKRNDRGSNGIAVGTPVSSNRLSLLHVGPTIKAPNQTTLSRETAKLVS